MIKLKELPKSIIPQPIDDRFPNQVELCKPIKGWPNPVEGNPRLKGPLEKKWRKPRR
jgi:hypothetical protein